MSIRKWQEIANQKEEVETQRKIILNTFKGKKVADEMGYLAAEKLFRPITTRLTPAEKPEEEAREDLYENFYQDLDQARFAEGDIAHEMANLFDDDGQELLGLDKGVAPKFVKNIPLPEDDDDDLLEEATLPEQAVLPEPEEEVLPGEKAWSSAPDLPSYSDVFPRRQKKAPESVYLSTLERFLKKKDPGAVLTIGDKKLTHAEAEQERFKIFASRAEQVLKGEKIGQKKLGPFTGKSFKEMRKMLGEKMSGKGFESLIPRLSLGISSIFAGNSSVKLRQEMKVIAELLFKAGILSKEQRKKVWSIK